MKKASGKTVMEGLLRNKPVPRVGLHDSPWADSIAVWVRQGYPTRKVHKTAGQMRWNPEDGRQIRVEVDGEYDEPLPAWQVFDYDHVGCGGWVTITPKLGVNEVIEENDRWIITRDGAGATFKRWKHKSGTPEHIDFHMTTREIWEQEYRPYVVNWDERRLPNPESVKRAIESAHAHDKWAFMGALFIWEGMRQCMGDLTLYQALLTDKAWIHDWCRVYTDLYKKAFSLLVERAGKPDGIWLYEDLGYKNGLFASPKVLSEMIFPYYAELVAFFHDYDLPVVLHTCGSTAEALPLIVEAGFDGLHPMERKAVHNDPFTFAERYRDKLAFIGGFDVRILESNDIPYVKREVAAYIEGMKARGARLVFSSDHSLPPTIHYDTYRAALDAYREHMWY